MVLKLCICGGGNGAHALAGLSASRRNVEVRVFTLFADEAERWTSIMGRVGHLTVIVHEKDGSQTEIKSKPDIITKDPKMAISGADVIVLTVPAFAHEAYLKKMLPYIQDSAILVGLPGKAGFVFECRHILGPKAGAISILTFDCLPWACRIKAFGESVEVLGTKSVLAAALIKGTTETMDPLKTLQMLHGPEPVFHLAKHFLEILLRIYSFLHPTIMYGQWHNWDGKPLPESPLFYQGVTAEVGELLSKCSAESEAIAAAIMQQSPDIDLTNVTSLYKWMLDHYGEDITDKSDLTHTMTTNKAYTGLRHPVVKLQDGVAPDFSNRYLTEDVPMGMIVVKGIALAAGVDTPNQDKIICWAQEKIGKKFLVNGELVDDEIASTRCPQRYGFKTLSSILTGKE